MWIDFHQQYSDGYLRQQKAVLLPCSDITGNRTGVQPPLPVKTHRNQQSSDQLLQQAPLKSFTGVAVPSKGQGYACCQHQSPD